MKNNKRLLSLALVLSLAATQNSQAQIPADVGSAVALAQPQIQQVAAQFGVKVSPAQVQEIAGKLIAELQDKMPLIEQFINEVQAGNFAELRQVLTAQSARLNTDQIMTFLAQNVGAFKGLLQNALDGASRNMKVLPPAVPSTVKENIAKAIDGLRNNLDKLDSVSSQLERVRPMINLPANIDFIIGHLEKAYPTKAFQAFLPQLATLKAQLVEAFNAIRGVDFAVIRDAAVAVQNKMQGKTLQLKDTLAMMRGVGVARRVAPHMIGIAEHLATLVVDLDNALRASGVIAKLPPEAQTAFDLIRRHAGELKGYMNQANTMIDKMKKEMGL